MRILALDLSLTATGLVVVDLDARLDHPVTAIRERTVIKTPSRRNGESDSLWNRRRYEILHNSLGAAVVSHRPEVVVTEVTEHFYHVTGGGKGKKSTKGSEYRAGYGLGRAIGWLDASMAQGYGEARMFYMAGYQQISASNVKLRVAGAQAASKAAVKDGLKTYFGLATDGWSEAEVDALAVAVAWAREREVGGRG